MGSLQQRPELCAVAVFRVPSSPELLLINVLKLMFILLLICVRSAGTKDDSCSCCWCYVRSAAIAQNYLLAAGL